MLFYVVDPLLPQWPSAPVETELFANVQRIPSTMWVPFPRSIDPSQIDTFIAESCPSFVLRSELAIIGLHPSSARAVLQTPDILDDVARRVEHAPLYIVYHIDGRTEIKHARGPQIPGLESRSTLDKIRDRDIAAVVRRPGTELPKHPKIHYRGPNGDHYRAFLRPALGVRSIEELDRISFWLAPLLSNKSNFLVDHWSMISIAYHVGQYSARELWTSAPICVQSVRSYDEGTDALSRRIGGTFGRVDSATGAVLISVNSSGRLLRDCLLPAMREVGFRNPDPVTVAIAATSSNSPLPDVETLTILDSDFAPQNPANCEACKVPDTILIPIPYDTYLLGLSAYIQSTAIGRKHVKDSSEMVRRYRSIGAFKTHTTHSDGRHHAYFVDLLPMLKQATFRKRSAEKLQAWQGQCIDLIIRPSHAAARELAAIVAQELEIRKVVECDEKLHTIGPNDELDILKAHRICIVDDVIISGSRLLGYRNSVNRYRRSRNHEDCELYCFIGVARTTSWKALVGISDMFLHDGDDQRLQYVECLFLPNWNAQDCRWCAEHRLLGKLPSAIQNFPFVRDRLDILRRSDGLVQDLFPKWPGDDGRSDEYWKLTSGSIFGDVQGADLAVSVASGIQVMRGKRRQKDRTWLPSELDEVFRSPIAKVLDPELFAAMRYYEPVIKASILRATRSHDIMAPGNEAALLAQFQMVVKDEDYWGLSWELIIAMAMDQLPRSLRNMIPECTPDLGPLVAAVLD